MISRRVFLRRWKTLHECEILYLYSKIKVVRLNNENVGILKVQRMSQDYY